MKQIYNTEETGFLRIGYEETKHSYRPQDH